MDNKKKKFNTNRVAAYALSGVMLASVIPYNVFANPEQAQNALTTAAAASGSVLESAPENVPVAVRDAAPPEDTSTSSDAKNAVHGFVGVLVGGDINADLAAENGQRFKPIEGVKVYFQWYEKTGNRTSPTYYAVSGADGQFHIKVKPYIGRDGKLVKFDADTSVSGGYESYKMWVDESTIPDGYQLQYSTGEGVEFTDRRVAGGGYQLGPNRLVNYRVLLMEKQDEAKMHKEATPTTPQISKTGQGALWGKVSWDYESAGGVQWGIVSTPTSPAEGVTVKASYLSDYALKQIYSADTATKLGLSKPSDIRGSGWTFKLETQLQDWIAEQVAKEKDKWIAETVSAVTNAEGDYLIQFKGTWGPRYDDESVATFTPPSGWTKEEKERVGTVAENAEDGSFVDLALNKYRKHVNKNWLFVSVSDAEGKALSNVTLRTPWNYNWYTGSNNAWGIHGGWAQSRFGVSTAQASQSARADFNLAPAEIKFNITNFDTQANTATPGDLAKTSTQGLPYKNTSDSFRIVWYDQEGNILKQEPVQKPTPTGGLAEASFDTKDVKETKTFIAKLHYVDSKGNLGQSLAQDAFTVKVNDKIGSRYEDVEFSNGETEGATYAATGLPNGLTIDASTGKVTGKPTEAGKFTVTTTISVPADDKDAEDISVDKTDQYIITDSPLEDGEIDAEYSATIVPTPIDGYEFDNVSAKFIDGKGIDGLTIEGDKISGTPTAKVEATQEAPNVEVTYDVYQVSDGTRFLVKKGHVDNVPLSIKEGEATKYEPVYEDAEGTVGEEATVAAPTFTDKEGNPATPEGEVTYEIGKDAPEGATVNEDGIVTYTPVTDDAGKTVEIPVTVKYSDGTTDDAVAKIKVADPQNMDYEPEYDEIDATAGEDATSTPTFKDGEGTKTDIPEGAKFTLGKGAPEDASVDPNTGVVTYNPGISKAGYTVKVPVVVTYKDGTTDKVEAPFKVAEADNAKYTAEYTPVTAQVGHEVTIASPEFYNKKDGNKVDPKPEVQKYEKGKAVKKSDGKATPIEGVTIDGTTGEIKYTAKEADKDSVIEVPVTVTYQDGSKEITIARINVPSDAALYNPKDKPLTTKKGKLPEAKDGVQFTLTPPEDTKYEWGTKPDVSKAGETVGIVKITYPDGTTDEVSVDVTVIDPTGPKIDKIGNQTVVEKQPIKEIEVKTDDPDAKITVDGLPDGVTYDEETGKITGSPEITDWDDTDKDNPEEVREVTVKVTAENESGNKSTEEFTITVQRDTDGDGIPDIYDKDDDGDGVPDDVEKEKGTDPKNKAETPLVGITDPNGINEIADQTVVEGKAITDITVEPEDDKAIVEVSGLPKGVTFEPKTKTISGTPVVENWGTEEEKEFTVEVTVNNEDGTAVIETFKITVQRDTDGDGIPDVTDTDDDGDGVSDEDEKKAGTDPKDKESKPETNKTIVDESDKKPVKPNGEDKDTGVKVENKDDDTKVTANDEDGKDVPVKIDEDGKVIVKPDEDVDGPITVIVEDPDLPDGKVEIEVPVLKEQTLIFDAKGGEPATQKANAYAGDMIQGINEPTREGFKFVKWVKLGTDKELDLTKALSADMLDESSNSIIFVAVWEKDTTTPAEKDADKYTPEVAKEEVEKGGEVDLTDNVTNLDKLPEGTTVKDVTPEGTIDINKPGDYTGKVEVTYPDGSKETVDVPVTVKDTTTPAEKDADKYTPEVAKEEVEKGGEVDLTDNVTNLDKLPEGTTVKDVTPEGTIDINKPGDYTGKVEVTYPDGSKETVDVPVTVKDETPSEDDTKVTGDVKPVDPTDEKQDTGINVENKDDDTKISAKDEDGKDVPVEIDEDGKVIVTPGEDVDGPITVVIEDKDLPDGKVEVEVPVIGHEKGRDDNNNGKPSDKNNTGGNDGYRPGHGGSDVFDRLFRRHDYTPTYPVKTVVPEKTQAATPVHDTLWYVFRINDFEYEVVRNGVVTKRKMDVTPVLQNDRTMLPLRYVAEALQADVTWDAKTRTATFTKDGLTASIQIDSDEIVLSNGKTVKMDSKPLNINDRILVSVTNVANVFGLTNGNTQDKVDQDIEWEQEDKSATIYIRR